MYIALSTALGIDCRNLVWGYLTLKQDRVVLQKVESTELNPNKNINPTSVMCSQDF